MKTDILTFGKLFILPDGRPISKALEPWQIKKVFRPIFYDLDRDGHRKKDLAVVYLPKKNYKSSMASYVAAYGLLADGEPEPEIYGTAGAKDQARIIFNQTSRAIERSPLLLGEVNIYRDVIERKDKQGFYRVLSSDAPLQHGLNPHFVLWDEVWNQPSYNLWEALTHSPARKQPLHYVTSYVGYRPWEGDLCYDLFLRGKRRKDKAMYFFYSQDNLAGIVTPGYLDQQRSRLPDHIFRRLHCNEWTTGSGSFLTREDVKAVVDPSLGQQFQGDVHGVLRYHLALDLGLRRDRTAIALVHKDPETGLVILDHLRLFYAPKGGEIQIEEVEDCILQLNQDFNLASISFDPWQSIRSKQRLEAMGLNITEFTFSGANIAKMTANLFTLFKDRQIRLFEHKELVKELLSVKIVERSYGYRIDHESGAHDDTVIALGMACLPCALEYVHSGPVTADIKLSDTVDYVGTNDPLVLQDLGIRAGGDWPGAEGGSGGGDW